MLLLCSQIGREEITIFSGLFVVGSYLWEDACQAIPGLWLVCKPLIAGHSHPSPFDQTRATAGPGRFTVTPWLRFPLLVLMSAEPECLFGRPCRKRARPDERSCQRLHARGWDKLQPAPAAGASAVPQRAACKQIQHHFHNIPFETRSCCSA